MKHLQVKSQSFQKSRDSLQPWGWNCMFQQLRHRQKLLNMATDRGRVKSMPSVRQARWGYHLDRELTENTFSLSLKTIVVFTVIAGNKYEFLQGELCEAW